MLPRYCVDEQGWCKTFTHDPVGMYLFDYAGRIRNILSRKARADDDPTSESHSPRKSEKAERAEGAANLVLAPTWARCLAALAPALARLLTV